VPLATSRASYCLRYGETQLGKTTHVGDLLLITTRPLQLCSQFLRRFTVPDQGISAQNGIDTMVFTQSRAQLGVF